MGLRCEGCITTVIVTDTFGWLHCDGALVVRMWRLACEGYLLTVTLVERLRQLRRDATVASWRCSIRENCDDYTLTVTLRRLRCNRRQTYAPLNRHCQRIGLDKHPWQRNPGARKVPVFWETPDHLVENENNVFLVFLWFLTFCDISAFDLQP